MDLAIALKLNMPTIFHREYKNDLGKSEPKSLKAQDQCLRVMQVALPFIALHKPFAKPLAIDCVAKPKI